MSVNPFSKSMSEEEKAIPDSGGDSPKFKPSSQVIFKFDSIRFPEEWFERGDGTKSLPINLIFACVSDFDGANEEGARHEEAFWLDADESGAAIDLDSAAVKTRYSILRRYAFQFFGGKGPDTPGDYPTDGNGGMLQPWYALRDYATLATAHLSGTALDSEYGVKLRKVKAAS